MNSRITTATTATHNELSAQLLRLGLRATASNLDDLIARATRQKLSPRQLIEALVRAESDDKALRNLQRRLALARIGRFRQMADFDWNWPKTLDREQIERALNLEFITEGRNLIPPPVMSYLFLAMLWFASRAFLSRAVPKHHRSVLEDARVREH